MLQWLRQRRRRRVRASLDVPAVLDAFREQANATGMPRGLVWLRVAAAGDPVLAADNGRLVALVLAEIDFEPDNSGDMDDAPGLELTRAATLVLRHNGGRWEADEKVLFNLAPEDVVARSGGRYKIL